MTTRTKPMKNQDWTQDEIDQLKQLAPEYTLADIAAKMQTRNEKSIRYKLYKIAFHELQDGAEKSHVYANYIKDHVDYQEWEQSHLARINASKNRESRPVETTEELLARLDRGLKTLINISKQLHERLTVQ